MVEALKPEVEMTRAKILKRKKICQIYKSFFFISSELTSCPASPRVVSRGVGKIQIPHAFWFFFATEKEQPFFILRLLLLQCLLVQPNIILHQVLKLAHALHTLRHSKNQVLFPFRCL